MMNMIEEIKSTLWIETRLKSRGLEYLEGVIYRGDLEKLNSLLNKYLGPPLKESGGEICLPKEIRGIIDTLGGLRKEQSFFYKQEGHTVSYASIWPWSSNPDKITLKCGVKKLGLPG
jgi:hypothetical protein